MKGRPRARGLPSPRRRPCRTHLEVTGLLVRELVSAPEPHREALDSEVTRTQQRRGRHPPSRNESVRGPEAAGTELKRHSPALQPGAPSVMMEAPMSSTQETQDREE